VSAKPKTFGDRSRWGRLLGGGIWLVFLGNPLGRLLDEPDDRARISGIVALGLFVAVYLIGLTQVQRVRAEGRYAAAWAAVVAMLGLTAAVVPGAGDQALTCLVFVATLAVATLPRWQALAAVVALFATTSLLPVVVDGWLSHGNNFAVVLASAAVWSFRLAWERQARLLSAERDLSELAVEQERDRIGRDLHDILGHSLTIITVKAELAERLIDGDPDRARAELIDLQRLSRDALADVRSTARGIRGISLPGEIASARMALESAGIRPVLPTVADEVPSRWRDLFAWTLREGVTNVIRHSEASECVVEVSADHIVVRDDGRGLDTEESFGSGLDGLRHRARLAGATVTTSPGPGRRGFELTVTVPA
jgi:two-component system sensor histidine kinase DesK